MSDDVFGGGVEKAPDGVFRSGCNGIVCREVGRGVRANGSPAKYIFRTRATTPDVMKRAVPRNFLRN